MKSVQQITDSLYCREINIDGFNVRSLLIRDDRHAVLWDTLCHPRDMRPFLPLIMNRQLTILYSHADYDHIYGTAGLPWQHARIIGQSNITKRFESDVPNTLQEMLEKNPGRCRGVQLIPPNQTVESSLELKLGSIHIILHALPGHTSDSMTAFLPDSGILLAGDSVERPLPCLPPHPNLTDWIESLNQWQADSRLKSVIPSHGPMGGAELLRKTRDYLMCMKKGLDVQLPDNLPPFYRETHANNLIRSKTIDC